MNAEEFLEVLRNRRSVRKFQSAPVPREDIERIITAASWAPSGTNHQNWHFTVVQSGHVRKEMADAVVKEVEDIASRVTLPQAQQGLRAYMNYFTFFSQAPVVIAVIKKPYNSVTQRIFLRYNLADRFSTSTDVQGPSAAIQNLVLMAHALGYGTCWMTGPLVARVPLEKILKVEPPDELMALIPLGKPAHVSPAPPRRKKLKEITAYL
ncbi:MAG: nitroreductase family protein [Endomicrobiales bacterium]